MQWNEIFLLVCRIIDDSNSLIIMSTLFLLIKQLVIDFHFSLVLLWVAISRQLSVL